jgi:hypothetical protein
MEIDKNFLLFEVLFSIMIYQNQWKIMFIVLDEQVVLAKQVFVICVRFWEYWVLIDVFVGYAISLVTRENWAGAGRLIKILEEAGQVFYYHEINE